MAEIKASSDEKVFRIQEFFGLNENADGDTKLKLGEASVMRNFKVTRDRSLQKRPGMEMVGSMTPDHIITLDNVTEPIITDNDGTAEAVVYPYVNLNGTTIVGLGTPATIDSNDAANGDYDNWFYQAEDGTWYKLYDATYPSVGIYPIYWNMTKLETESISFSDTKVKDLWIGNTDGIKKVYGWIDDTLILVWQEDVGFLFRAMDRLNRSDSQKEEFPNVSLFGFENKFWVVNGMNLWQWIESDMELSGLAYVFGGILEHPENTYAPVIAVSIPSYSSGEASPGTGTTLQRPNLLNRVVRVWLSPGGGNRFDLPGENLPATLAGYDVKNLVTGEYIGNFNVTRNDSTGVTTIILNGDIVEGENVYEVIYSAFGTQATGFGSGSPFRGMSQIEFYNGTTDARVFYYGNGTNKVYYSDFDENGVPRADYVPDLNVISVGTSSTPVTGLIRHYSRLIAFKEDETYSIQYGTITLPDNTTTAAFYCTPVNKRIGNSALGQVRLVLNAPFSLHGNDVYEWRNTAAYSSNLTIDERQAKRISDRVYSTLSTFDLSKCYCYDDNDHQEYYICYDKKALVYNYAADVWYYYTNFDVTCMVNIDGELYAGDSLGRFNHISREYRTDNGTEITGYWASGSEPFDREFMRKYSAMLWVVLRPELRSQVTVTVETDRKSDHAKKVAASSLMTFGNADFRKWSFNTNRKPHTIRLKIKAKKFTYYKLILEYSGTNTTATVVAADMRIRYTGYAK